MSIYDTFKEERAAARSAKPEPKKPGFFGRITQSIFGKKEEPEPVEKPGSVFERFQQDTGKTNFTTIEGEQKLKFAPKPSETRETSVKTPEKQLVGPMTPALQPNMTLINGAQAYVRPPGKQAVGGRLISPQAIKDKAKEKLDEIEALIGVKKEKQGSIRETTPRTLGVTPVFAGVKEEDKLAGLGAPKKAQADIDVEIGVLQDAAHNYRAVVEHDPNDTGFFSSFVDGLEDSFKEPEKALPFVGAAISAGDKVRMRQALEKKSRGEELTDFESALVEKFISENIPIDRGLGYNVGLTVGGMPTYVAEFALSAGMFSAGKTAAAHGVSKIAEKVFIPRFVQRVVPHLIGAATQNVTGFAPRIAEKTAEYMLPRPELIANGQGDAIISSLDVQGDNFAKAFAKAFGVNYVEVLSERAGVLVEKPMRFLQKATIGKWLAKHGLSKGDDVISRILKVGGWNGVIGEVFEEELANLGQAPIEGRPVNLPFLTPEGTERLLTETLGIGIFGGISRVPSTVASQMNRISEQRPVIEAPQMSLVDEMMDQLYAKRPVAEQPKTPSEQFQKEKELGRSTEVRQAPPSTLSIENVTKQQLITPQEALDKTPQDLADRWDTLSIGLQDNFEKPILNQIKKLEEDLKKVGRSNSTEAKAKRSDIKNKIKEQTVKLNEAREFVDSSQLEFAEELADIAVKEAESRGIVVDDDFRSEFLETVYERPGIESFWETPVREIIDSIKPRADAAVSDEAQDDTLLGGHPTVEVTEAAIRDSDQQLGSRLQPGVKLDPRIAEGRIQDVALKLEKFNPDLVETFTEQMNAEDTTIDNIIETGVRVLKGEGEVQRTTEKPGESQQDIKALEKQLLNTYKNKQEFEQTFSEIAVEMELSQPGERLFTEDGVIASPSTFPQWIPEHLRSSKLFEKVMEKLQADNFGYPEGNRSKQRALYDALLSEADARLGIDTSALRGRITSIYERRQEKGTTEQDGGRARGGELERVGLGSAQRVASLRALYATAEARSKPLRLEDIQMNEEIMDALRDVNVGRTTQSRLPLLVSETGDGKFVIEDGKHRLVQQYRDGQRTFRAITNEALYRELSDKEEELRTVDVRGHERAGVPVTRHVRSITHIERDLYNIANIGDARLRDELPELRQEQNRRNTSKPDSESIKPEHEAQAREKAQSEAKATVEDTWQNMGNIEGGLYKVAPQNNSFNPKNLAQSVSTKKGMVEVDKIVRRSEIAKALSEKLQVPIRRGKLTKHNALGQYKPNESVIRLREKGAGGLPTLFHETGHFIDYRIHKFAKDLQKHGDELNALFASYGNQSLKGLRQAEEAFGEFMDFYMSDPAKAAKLAPKFFVEFEKTMEEKYPEVHDVILEARQDNKRWEEQPAVAKVLSQISFEEQKRGMKERVKSRFHHLYEQAIDDLHPIEEFTKMAKKEGAIPSEDNPYMLARNFRGWTGKAQTFLEKGTFNRRFWKEQDGKLTPEFTGRSFKDIVNPIENEGQLVDFTAYLVSKRAVELHQRGITTGIRVSDAQAAVEELESKYPNFEAAQKELVKYQDAVLNYGFQSGLYDQKTLDKIRELNKEYVPFYRVHEELQSRGFMGRGFANLSKNIKRIKGSERDIVNPLESIVKNTYTIINASERNAVMMAMVNLSKRSPDMARMFEPVPLSQTKVATVNVNEVLEAANIKQDMDDASEDVKEQFINIFRPAFIEKGNVLTVLVNGKRKAFETDPDIYRALQGLEVENAGTIIKLFSYPAKFLRAGATLAPEFMVRNPARDQMTAMVYSQNGFIPVVDMTRGFFSLFNQDSTYWLWRMGGGSHATMVALDRTNLKKTVDELTKKSAMVGTLIKNPLKLMQIVSEFGEQGTRLGEARKALARMKDPIEAAFNSREVTLDFARIGSKTRAVNMLVAFWNANVQGTDKLVRSFKNHPYRTAARTFMGITLPSILLYLVNRDDPRWKEIPQWQKDLFWIVMTEDHIYRIPKPFELGVIFGSVPERILEYIDSKDADVLDTIKESAANGLAPGFIPTAMLPLLENITNYNLFLDRQIVPFGVQQLPPEAQYTTYTTETSKVIGEWIKYSPAKIDNLINGYFAGLGRYAVKTSDAILKGTGIVDKIEEPEGTLADTPVIKAFVVREPIGSSSESVNRFFAQADKAQQGKNFYNDLMKDGKRDKAEEYLADHQEIRLAPHYSKVRNIISKLRKQKDMIRESGILSPKAKREKMEELDRLITDLAQKSLEMTLKE